MENSLCLSSAYNSRDKNAASQQITSIISRPPVSIYILGDYANTKVTSDLLKQIKNNWTETRPDLHADEEEGVDVRDSTEQTLVQDDSKHQPDAGQELVTHSKQEQHCIQNLWRTNG